MKIIKQGKKTGKTVVKFECNECGSVFEEEPKNCRSLYRQGIDERTTFSVECPVCGEKVRSDITYISVDDKGSELKPLTGEEIADLLRDIEAIHGKVPEKTERLLRASVGAGSIGDYEKLFELLFIALIIS